MTIYVGEALTIIGAAVNPVNGQVINDAAAVVEFYSPNKAPKTTPADRVSDKGPFALVYDASVANKDGTTGAYVGFVDTAGWEAGKWSFKVTLSGTYDSWEYGSVTLAV